MRKNSHFIFYFLTPKNNMKKLLLTLFALIQGASMQAQLVSSTYHWYKLSKTYSAISGSASVLASGSTIDDALYSNQTLGFTFKFNGTDYTTLGVSTNGFIWFGTATASTLEYQPISTNDGCDGVVSVF